MRLTGLALCSTAALAIGCGAARANETINVGICVSWPGYAMQEVARQKGLIPGYDLKSRSSKIRWADMRRWQRASWMFTAAPLITFLWPSMPV